MNSAYFVSLLGALFYDDFDEEFFRFVLRIVKTVRSATFEPRKTPVQQRSTATVEAISEATIQVLLAVGLDRLTTTRVAERAGLQRAFVLGQIIERDNGRAYYERSVGLRVWRHS
jgi:hypothetical protein